MIPYDKYIPSVPACILPDNLEPGFQRGKPVHLVNWLPTPQPLLAT